ncbi:MAG: DNA polymerase I [Thermoactinomyces sp.]
MDKLILVDGNSIAYRAFYALPLLSNASGVYTNSVYGFTMMLLKILEDEQPTHMLVAFDAGKTTFRHKDYQAYKGARQKTPGELSEQFPLIKQVLDAFGIPYFEKSDYEADDIIGTLARNCASGDVSVRIVSGDKDLLQLVNDDVDLLLTRKGITEMECYDPRAIEKKYGLKPQQIIDLKGLMGDASDNIPGIPGVGEKTALKLLHLFPSVEEVVEHADELPGKKLREKVKEHREQALLSKKLATIYTEVPLSLDLEDLRIRERDEKRVVELFKQLEFKTLLSRLENKDASDPEQHPAESPVSYQMIETDQALESWSGFFANGERALFAEVTEDHPVRGELLALAVSDGEMQLVIPARLVKENSMIRNWLSCADQPKIVFDAKTIRSVLQGSASLKADGISFDVLLAAYLLDPSESHPSLSQIVSRRGDGDLPSDEAVYGKGAKRRQLEGEELAKHIAHKALSIYRLGPVLQEQLQEARLDRLMHELELPLSFILSKMERQGVAVDEDRLNELGRELKASMDQLEKEIHQIAGVNFNINSPKQLGEILFDKLGLPVIKKTKTGYSTSADVLEKLAPQHEIVEKILHYRQVGKLYSTYIEGLRKEIGPDGKIHTQFRQTITATGRLSSTEPNLQNIPIRLEEGRRIRQVFIPSREDLVMLAADYSQIELRVLAHLSRDENLQRAFREDKDIHTRTAMDIFGVSEDEVTPLMRRQAKAVNFGIVYGISGYGLSQGLDIPQKEAKAFIDRYFATYPGVKSYMDRIVLQAKKDGYVTTMLGRRRYLPKINARNYGERSFAERTAMNTPIQGTAADIIKYAMVKLDRSITEKGLKSRMLLQVHDELIFEVPEEELPEMRELVRDTMENAVELSVPLKVDLNVGSNWYEAK